MSTTTTKPDLFTLNERKTTIINLKKEKGIENQKAQVVLALDFSGSMTDLYRTGRVQNTIERLLPLGLAFDDNQEVDFYLFHDDVIKMPETINLKNLGGYINDKVIGKYGMGGTDYAPVISQIVKDFGNGGSTVKRGLFGFGSKEADAKVLDLPVYVIFITDGETGNRSGCELAIKDASHNGIFFQFLGIGNEQFNFLKKLDTLGGRLIDNANFQSVNSLDGISDSDLYKLLLAEFPSWIPLAKAKNLIK